MATRTHINVVRTTGKGGASSWSLRVFYPDPITGKRREAKRRGFPTKGDAEAAGQELVAELLGGRVAKPGRHSVDDGYQRFADYNADRVAVGTLKRASAIKYEDTWRLYIEPYWSGRRLDSIGPDEIRALFRLLRSQGFQRGVLLPVWHVARKLYELAEVGGLCAHSPFRRVGKRSDVIGQDEPAVDSDQWWTVDELDAFHAALDEHPHQYGNLWRLMVATGLRRGEALAITDRDIDGGTLTVDKQWTYENGRGSWAGYLSTPKTRAGTRQVPLTSIASAILEDARLNRDLERMRCGDAWPVDDPGFVFARGAQAAGRYGEGAKVPGTLPHPTMVTRQFRRFCEAHRLRAIKLHGLRHTWASHNLAAGVPLGVVSKLIGHASIDVTANVYAHISADVSRDAADALDAYYAGR